MQKSAVEAAVLDCVRGLLTDLGSEQAARRASLDASLDGDLGLGSLERVELLVRVEAAAGVRLPDGTAQSAETPGEWAAAVLAAAGAGGRRSRFPIVQPAREAAPPPTDAATFTEVLRGHVERDPARVQVHLLDGDDGEDIGYGRLYERSAEVAAGLAASGLKPGETVAVMLPTCADFFYAFLGAMLAGGVAVPIYPPARPSQIEEYVRRQTLILRNAGIRFLISFDRVRAVSKAMEFSLPTLREVVTAAELAARGRAAGGVPADPSDIFFLQYTSGSTGNPKGVTLTHANVLANVRAIGGAVEAAPDDAVVSWLPLYHDMGLIGSWLFSLYYGFPITVLSPLDFLSRPERWLWALSDSRGTLCPAPNFAYEICTRKIGDEALQGVDLSPWRVVISGGEPVLPATIERFTERFRPWGFDPRGFLPCYGLAESSVALTFPPLGRGPLIDVVERAAFEREGRAVPVNGAAAAGALRFVANGAPLPEHRIRVVDDEGADLPERMRGRVIFQGPSRTPGYFRNLQATSAAIDSAGWMDTGDLGYFAGGEIYITGRLKDCIVKAGCNIIPQDVEMASWEAEGVRKGCVAAFGSIDADSGTEKLVVVAETRLRDPQERRRAAARVVECVARKIGQPPDDVVLAAPETVPKTSSGKIRRAETRRMYEAGELNAGKRAAPWLQIARLRLETAHSWAAAGLRRAAARARTAALFGLQAAAALLCGLAARTMPAHTAAAAVIRFAAGRIAALSGIPAGGALRAGSPCVWTAARADRLNPLLLAAGIRSPFVFADHRGFAELPSAYAFLLDPLAADPRRGLQDCIRAALDDGLSVVVSADNPPGETIARSRFRLEAFAAARAAGAPVVPLRMARNEAGRWAFHAGEAVRVTNGVRAAREAVRANLLRIQPADAAPSGEARVGRERQALGGAGAEAA